MAHRAQGYIAANILPTLPKGVAVGYVVTHFDAATIESLLVEDAKDYIYSAVVSFADGCRGLLDNYYSWSTTKFYYSVFYGLRGILALNRVALFYQGPKPRVLEARAGTTVKAPPSSKKSSTTHGFVLETFRAHLPNHFLLSQDIANQTSVEWLKSRREEANYLNSRYWEPRVPKHFSNLEKVSLRKLLGSYLSDPRFTLTFDPDHAMLSFPVAMFHTLRQEFSNLSLPGLEADDKNFLIELFKDDAGPMSTIQSLFA